MFQLSHLQVADALTAHLQTVAPEQPIYITTLLESLKPAISGAMCANMKLFGDCLCTATAYLLN
jgi:hypothetical protein